MLKAGDSVTFTGTDGAVNTYVVSETATISPTETEKVTESGYPSSFTPAPTADNRVS